MIAENKTKNANFLRLLHILRSLREDRMITPDEYDRAKKYYRKLTGADIVIAN